MSSSDVLGQFLWHELLTSDPEAGGGFYSKVFGWKAQPWDAESGYTMLGGERGPVGGARVLGKDLLADTVGPSWLTYVGVPDLTAALETVAANGGKVVHPVTALPDPGGRYAVINDPQGGAIGLFEPPASGGGGGQMAGPMAWHELSADDVEGALAFYKEIFGWEVVATHPMGGEVGDYYIFGIGTTQLGGGFKRPKHLPPTWPHWLVYLSVPDVTAAVAAAQAAGGTLLQGPHQVPGGHWIAQIVDSHGVPIAVHGAKLGAVQPKKAAVKPKPKVKTKAAAKAAPAKKAPPAKKAKTKPATKAAKKKSAPKAKVVVKGKKAKGKAKSKSKPKAKSKAKTASRAKAAVRSVKRKVPRRAK